MVFITDMINAQNTLGVFVSGESFTYKLDTWADPGLHLGLYATDKSIISGWYKEIRVGATHTKGIGTTAQAGIGGGYLFNSGWDVKILPRLSGVFSDAWYMHLGTSIGYRITRDLTIYTEYSLLPRSIGSHTFGITAYMDLIRK